MYHRNAFLGFILGGDPYGDDGVDFPINQWLDECFRNVNYLLEGTFIENVQELMALWRYRKNVIIEECH